MEWTRKTCESCLFRIADTCRKNPPSIKLQNPEFKIDFYPTVLVIEGREYVYQVACSQWEKGLNNDSI